jgi:hypothetical protein
MSDTTLTPKEAEALKRVLRALKSWWFMEPRDIQLEEDALGEVIAAFTDARKTP